MIGKYREKVELKTLMLQELNAGAIQFIDSCQAYECNFTLFLVAFGFLLAEVLSFYDPKTVSEMTVHYLFQKIVQKIDLIRRSTNPQLPE